MKKPLSAIVFAVPLLVTASSAAQVHPVPVKTAPLPYKPEPKTLAEHTPPAIEATCDMLVRDGRRGSLGYQMEGAKAYPREGNIDLNKKYAQSEIGKTSPKAVILSDPLDIIPIETPGNPIASLVFGRFEFGNFGGDVTPNTDVRALLADVREVSLIQSKNPYLLVADNGGGNMVAMGFCKIVKKTQKPLTNELLKEVRKS